MKFARLLRTTAEDLPELQCLFHIYKHLKKQLKQLPARSEGKPTGADGQTPTGRTPDEAPGDAGGEVQHGNRAVASEASEEARFTAVLTDHLQRLNDRFLEREETCVIQLERLEAETAQCTQAAKAATAGSSGAEGGAGTSDGRTDETVNGAAHLATLKAIAEQRAQLYKRFVNFHGEVLLLVHWSVLAYTATVKILKKHHKRTGLLLRAPQLADLLSQPFCSSELMTGLARKAEACIQRLAEQLASSATSGGTTGGGAAEPDGAAGGGPQVTVDQADALAERPSAAAALGTAAAVDDDSYGVADGSSPSCSQSPGDLLTRRLGAATSDQPQSQLAAEAAHAEAATAAAAAVAETPTQRRERLRRRRQVQRPREEGEALVGGAGDGGGGGRAGAGARAIGGGGASFLRNLTRLSDNSAASLSGPYVLEQLAELQHIVDKYDNMDDDDLDDIEEEEDSGAVGTGGAAAAVAAVHGGRPHATAPPPHHHHHRSEDAGRADAAAAGPSGEAAAAAAGCAHAGGDDGGGTAAGPGVGAAPPERATAVAGTPGGMAQLEPRQLHPAQSPPSSPPPGGSDCLSLPPQLRGPAAERDPSGAPPQRQQPQDLPAACTGGAAAGASGDVLPREVVPVGQSVPQQPHQQAAAPPPLPPPTQQHQLHHQGGESRRPQQPQHQHHHHHHHQRMPHQNPPQQHHHSQLQPQQQPQRQQRQQQQQQQPEGGMLSWGIAPWGPISGSGSGSGSVPTADGQQPGQARFGAAPPQSSSGSAAATAGGGGGAGSVSVALSDAVFAGLTGGNPMGGRPASEAGGANLLRRTQVALTMWEHLRANASTPSTVIDPAAGPKGPGQGGGGGGDVLRGKRRRPEEEGGGAEGEEVDSVADDSGSTSD